MSARPWAPPLLWAGAVLVATSIPNPPVPSSVARFDKVVHLAMYGVLAWLLARAAAAGRAAIRALAVAVLVAAAFGAADEWHQRFIPGRSMDVDDWLADVSGAVVGASIAVATLRRRTPSTI